MRRDDLIRSLWPDKLLYGCTMIFATGILGLIHAGMLMVLSVSAVGDLPRILLGYGPGATLFLSAVATVLGWIAFRRKDTTWALWGAGVGFVTFALFGLGSLFSLVAAGFVLASRSEGEHLSPHAKRLDPRMWPDKSLAASMLILLLALLSLAWGALLLTGLVQLSFDATPLGGVAILAGLVAGVAAWSLYHQRHAWLGLLACLLGMGALAFYVLGPLLAVAALVLIARAKGEKEFDPETKRRLHGDAA